MQSTCIVHAFVCAPYCVSALALKFAEQPDEVKKWIAEEELACAENNFKSRSS